MYSLIPCGNIPCISATCTDPECPTATPPTAEPIIAGTESFSVSSDLGLFTLSTGFDYEVAQRYVVVMGVVDNGGGYGNTGQVVVRVNIT